MKDDKDKQLIEQIEEIISKHDDSTDGITDYTISDMADEIKQLCNKQFVDQACAVSSNWLMVNSSLGVADICDLEQALREKFK